MAIETIKAPLGAEEIINVNAKVGKGGMNNSNDVVVVQSLIAYYRKFAKLDYAAFVAPQSRPDGICTSTLVELIAHYQGHINADVFSNEPNFLVVDGVASRARGKASWTTGKIWTIVSLNRTCRITHHDRHGIKESDFISDIRKEFPEIERAL